jgi:hypothetical protein
MGQQADVRPLEAQKMSGSGYNLTVSSFDFCLPASRGRFEVVRTLTLTPRCRLLPGKPWAHAKTQCPLTCRGRLPIREDAHLAYCRTLFSSN